MYHNRAQSNFRNAIILGDLIIINLCFALAYILRFGDLSSFYQNQYGVLLLIFNLAWVGAIFINNIYNYSKTDGRLKLLIRLLQLLLLHFLFLIAFNGLVKTLYSRKFILYAYSLILFLLPLIRLGINYFNELRLKTDPNKTRFAILGNSNEANELLEFFNFHKEYGYANVGMYDHSLAIDDLPGLKASILNSKVQELYCSLASVGDKQVADLIDFCDNNLIRIKFLPRSQGFYFKKLGLEFYDQLPVLSVRSIPLDNYSNRVLKRGFDVLFSFLVAVFILTWLVPILAVLIKLESRGPVFFKQKRSGRNNEIFTCLKFRTMRENTTSDRAQAIKGDERITKMGNFLRRSNLDEMPQFLNVLLGEMSVVGPRPHMLSHTEQYAKIIDKYMVRHLIKPGITGLSQVKGYRGETKRKEDMRNRVKVDIFYAENWTFWLDLKVVVLTLIKTFTGDDKAY